MFLKSYKALMFASIVVLSMPQVAHTFDRWDVCLVSMASMVNFGQWNKVYKNQTWGNILPALAGTFGSYQTFRMGHDCYQTHQLCKTILEQQKQLLAAHEQQQQQKKDNN